MYYKKSFLLLLVACISIVFSSFVVYEDIYSSETIELVEFDSIVDSDFKNTSFSKENAYLEENIFNVLFYRLFKNNNYLVDDLAKTNKIICFNKNLVNEKPLRKNIRPKYYVSNNYNKLYLSLFMFTTFLTVAILYTKFKKY
ncbi:hypothetical protein [Mycoplasma sp. P36-A1]|uniref:hypothetical protein n=1 Tax=Mycoplasma sp. P36-A1 TaxID=3252900 RepID=UPI003C30D52E